jgi:predicted ATPase
MRRLFEQVWNQLRSQHVSRRDHLRAVRIAGLRGIRDLEVRLDHPVSVLAGPNACGKTTVLLALACAYQDPCRSARELAPSSLFPDLRTPRGGGLPADARGDVELSFEYAVEGRTVRMRWRRRKSWNRSGLEGSPIPRRRVYVRTLANLTNPSEVRSLLQIGRRRGLTKSEIDVALLNLAIRILGWRYERVLLLERGGRDLLFAVAVQPVPGGDEEVAYSEFHMSSGERAVLRLSKDLSDLEDALVLIDEVEAGLHPFTQQQLMLELQRLALRQHLQIVVTTHSPVVLDCVAPEGRVFLERVGGNVVRRPVYRDIVQRAFYGVSRETLTLLCEDDAAKAVIRGVLDYLAPRLDLEHGDIVVGRDSGKQQFRHYVEVFAQLRQLDRTVFVLDGDAADLLEDLRARAAERGQHAHVLLLPGHGSPEQWAWSLVHSGPEDFADALEADPAGLARWVREIHDLYGSAADTEANKAKGCIHELARRLDRAPQDLLRRIARLEAERGRGEMRDFVERFQDVIRIWRGEPE